MIKYFCDRCGKELVSNNFSNCPYEVKFYLYISRDSGASNEKLRFDVCLKCKKEIEKDIKKVLRKNNLWSEDTINLEEVDL